MKFVRYLTVCLVLVVFLLTSFGPAVIFQAMNFKHIEDINRIVATAENSKLLKLEIPWSDLNNREIFNYEHEEYEKEFLYRGHIYNIKKEEVTAKGIIFYCVNDSYEDALIAKLNAATKGDFDQLPSKGPVNPFSKKSIDFIASRYFAPESSDIVLFDYLRFVASDYEDVILQVIPHPPLLS